MLNNQYLHMYTIHSPAMVLLIVRMCWQHISVVDINLKSRGGRCRGGRWRPGASRAWRERGRRRSPHTGPGSSCGGSGLQSSCGCSHQRWSAASSSSVCSSSSINVLWSKPVWEKCKIGNNGSGSNWIQTNISDHKKLGLNVHKNCHKVHDKNCP